MPIAQNKYFLRLDYHFAIGGCNDDRGLKCSRLHHTGFHLLLLRFPRRRRSAGSAISSNRPFSASSKRTMQRLPLSRNPFGLQGALPCIRQVREQPTNWTMSRASVSLPQSIRISYGSRTPGFRPNRMSATPLAGLSSPLPWSPKCKDSQRSAWFIHSEPHALYRIDEQARIASCCPTTRSARYPATSSRHRETSRIGVGGFPVAVLYLPRYSVSRTGFMPSR